MTAPTPPAGVEAHPSPLAERGCVGEWLVRTGPHNGLRIHLYDRPDGRHLELSGYLGTGDRATATPGQAKAMAWALLRADDWASAAPRPDDEPADPDPQISIYDLLEATA